MTRKRWEWKKEAKRSLQGHYGIMILSMFVTYAASMAASTLTERFFPESGTLTYILSLLFAFVVSVILTLFSAGYDRMNLMLARREEVTLKDLWYFWKNGSDRVLTAGFVMTALNYISLIPNWLFHRMVEAPKLSAAMTELSDAGIRTAVLRYQTNELWSLMASVALQTLLFLPFAMVYYLLVDHPEMGGLEALKNSAKMIGRKMWKLLLLHISFLPLILAATFLTLGLGLIWVVPYMNMTVTEFYRDLNGEFPPHDQYFYEKYVPEQPVNTVLLNEGEEEPSEKGEQ
ncbi:MAG: DUF975 family protein [Clostridiales bacterium]|nr:DUF975 family protein [Candidatus Blautia equi]